MSFIHPDRDTSEQSNNMVSEYEMDTLVSELTVANMVFENSFTVLDPAGSDFDFLEQLSPRCIIVQKNSETGSLDEFAKRLADPEAAQKQIHVHLVYLRFLIYP